MMSRDEDTRADSPSSSYIAPEAASPEKDGEGENPENVHQDGRVPDYLARVAPVTVPPTRIQLSLDVIVDNFSALLESVAPSEALNILELGRIHFIQRRRMRKELQALYAGLWNLALQRSFPDDYTDIFSAWLEKSGAELDPHDREERQARIFQYVDSLRQYGDADFSEVSRHLTGLLEADESHVKRISFALALYIRRIYTYFFDHLL